MYKYINKKIHIKDIASITIVNGKINKLYKAGSNLIDTICPNCKDERGFRINIEKSYGKCYKCNFYCQNTIDYYMKVNNKSRQVAEKELLSIFHLNNIQINEKKDKEKESEINEKEPLDTEILDKIYKIFSNTSELIGEKKLSDEDYKYLLSRNLTKEEIEEYGFFSCPYRGVMSKFIKVLEENDLLKYLGSTPGFYYDVLMKEWTFNYNPAIVIPIKNEFGHIVGLQFRNLFEEGKFRYRWFSSNNEKEVGYINGTSSGSPLSILYPKTQSDNIKIDEFKKNNETLAVVEGFFKAITLQKLGYNVISVQGVYSAKSANVDKIIKNIFNIKNINIKNIIIYFDADMQQNNHVMKAVINISDDIANKYNISVATWDIEVGKGIDDYLDNEGKIEEVVFIKYNKFKSIAKEIDNYIKNNNIKNSAEDKKMLIYLFKTLAGI